MHCRECELLLWAFIDGELPATQRQVVATHLEGCARCSRVYEQLSAFPLQIGQLHSVAPPADFSARLMARIALLPPPAQLAAERERMRPNIWSGPTGMIVAFSAAAAAIFLGLISTSALVLAGGSRGDNARNATGGIANAIGGGVVRSAWDHLSAPLLLVLAVMLAILTLLWFRVVAPRR